MRRPSARLVRSVSSTPNTATAAFAGPTVAIGCGLIASVAYVRGVVLGALSDTLSRLRRG